MPEPSLYLTQTLQSLLQVKMEERTEAWMRDFIEAVDDAALVVPDPQVIQGPDSLSYFALRTPEPEEEFSPVSLRDVLDHCLEQGHGLVLNPQLNPPSWVFTFGMLWSRKDYGTFDTSSRAQTEPEDPEATQIEVAMPSEDLFPPYARNAVRRFFLEKLSIEEPKVMLITSARHVPSRALVFNCFRENCKDDEQFQTIMHFLRWFFPNHYGIASIAKDSGQLTEHFHRF